MPADALVSDSRPAPIIELEGVSMRFGAVSVLQHVEFQVWPGEVVGLVGDNGAGKSTLLKILTGYHEPTGGAIRILGEQREFHSPAEARALGIETVYQDLALIDEMPLWRNFFLGQELRRSRRQLGLLDRQTMRRQCEAALTEIGLTRFRSADAYASSLSGGERQSLAIMRAMHFGAILLLLDEPTAALSVKETRKVIAAIEHARSNGLGVVYIDHNMAHVQPVADRIVVVKHGRISAEVPRGAATLEQLNDLLAET